MARDHSLYVTAMTLIVVTAYNILAEWPIEAGE